MLQEDLMKIDGIPERLHVSHYVIHEVDDDVRQTVLVAKDAAIEVVNATAYAVVLSTAAILIIKKVIS
jgi:hypothetical protein